MLLTNIVSVKSALAPKSQWHVDQNSSFTYGCTLLWTLYCKHSPHIGGFNKYLDADKDTLSIRPNEELADFYSRTLHPENIELSNAIISLNILLSDILIFLFNVLLPVPFCMSKKIFSISYLQLMCIISYTSQILSHPLPNFLKILTPWSS